ncbi:hypothetical protein FRC10_012118 [Ceratobasidium sp. 414]|nr:hypothetical protein FRC10_012118 [Ceratobasidium sp. 414]
MYGIRVDGNDGPRRSTQAVARCREQGQHHSPAWIEDRDIIMSETISTQTSRDSNYIHQGWSITAAATVPPWTASRIAQNLQADGDGRWTTKRTIVQRLALDIPPRDLIAVPEFEADIQAALGKPTAFDKFRALDNVFHIWGDVVPIVFELGALLAISDTDPMFTQLPNRASGSGIYQHIRLPGLTSGYVPTQALKYSNGRLEIASFYEGGDTSVTPDDIVAWLSMEVHPSKWAQARIVRVISTTELLRNDLKKEIEALYSGLLSYYPPVLEGNSMGSTSFDGTPHALNPIRSIIIHADSLVDSLATVCSNGTGLVQHGGPGGEEQIFCLRHDEFIVEVVVWTDQETTCGIQFVTNKGRISPHYGGNGGAPSILNCEGGALAAFSGKVKRHSYWKKDMIYRIQTIWRHDVVPVGLTRGHSYSTFFGGTGGTPFNDWPYHHSSDTIYVSGITVHSGKYIESIQATYTYEGQYLASKGLCHGVKSDLTQSFTLRPGEHFVKVQGRCDNWIVQLCFITNRALMVDPGLGRSSPVYGGNGGQTFECEAPEGKRLCFIMGKSHPDVDTSIKPVCVSREQTRSRSSNGNQNAMDFLSFEWGLKPITIDDRMTQVTYDATCGCAFDRVWLRGDFLTSPVRPLPRRKHRPTAILADSEKSYLLDGHGCLYGIHVDAHSGPRRPKNPVARCKAEGLRYKPNWIQEAENTVTEVIDTKADRHANYVHHGWSVVAATTLTPWTASRIARGQEPALPGNWTTERTTVGRITVKIPLEDIAPEPQFETEVEVALRGSTDFQKFEKLNEVFDRWYALLKSGYPHLLTLL